MDVPVTDQRELFLDEKQTPEQVRRLILKAIEKSNILFQFYETQSFKYMGILLGLGEDGAEEAQYYFNGLCDVIYNVVKMILTERGLIQKKVLHGPIDDTVFQQAVLILKEEYDLPISIEMVKALNGVRRLQKTSESEGFKGMS